MANSVSGVVRIKRRAAAGAAGAPASLKSGEPAWNNADQTLYIGAGDDGSGNATSVPPIGGPGAVVMRSGDQSVAGTKTFGTSPIVPTPSANDNSQKAASTAYVDAAVAAVVPDNGSIGNAKLAPMAASTIKGRASGAGSGDPTDLSAAQVKAVLALTKADVGLGNVDNTSDANKPVSAAQQTALNGKLDKAGGTLTGDLTLAGAPTANLHAASKAYVDGIVAAQDGLKLTGVLNCSANPNYPAGDAGLLYRVSVAGKIGGAAGPNVEVGDILLCLVDGSAAGNHATVGANWTIMQANVDGTYFVGGNDVAVADGGTGASTAAGARTNLGLGTMATQNASAVAITGGSFDGVTMADTTFDGGTF